MLELPLMLDVPAVRRSYRLVSSPSAFRVTCTIQGPDATRLVHHRHDTLAAALADLLLTIVADGDAIVPPLCDEAAIFKAGWKYGRPGFPARSGILKRLAAEKSRAFEDVAIEYGRAVKVLLDLGCSEPPTWLPMSAWLAAALEEVGWEIGTYPDAELAKR